MHGMPCIIAHDHCGLPSTDHDDVDPAKTLDQDFGHLDTPPRPMRGGAGLTTGRCTFGLQLHVRLDQPVMLPQQAHAPCLVHRLWLHEAQVSPQATITPTRVCGLELPQALQEALVALRH
jgi:hypothetical protein